MAKQKKLGTSYQLSYKTCLEKFNFRSNPSNVETVEIKGKKLQNIWYLQTGKRFLEEIKTIFHNFWNVSFWKNTKK